MERTSVIKNRLTERMEKELSRLERELRIELPQAIKTAVAMGDLRENAEYHAALERQNYVKLRIAQLRKKLGDLAMIKIDSIPRDRIGLGSQVVLLEDESGREVSYELVLPDDGDVPQGRVSVASPLGRGVMGKKVGDEVTIRTPSGSKTYEVLHLRTLHELQGTADGGEE